MYLITIYNSGVPLVIHGDFASVDDCKIAEEKNSIDSMTFSIYPNNSGYNALREFSTTITCRDVITGDVVFDGRVLSAPASMDEDGAVCKNVTCEGVAGYLCDSVQPYTEETTYEDGGGTTGLQKFVDTVLGNHNSSVPAHKRIYRGTVDKQTFLGANNVTKQLNFERTWDALKAKLIDVFGGEMRVRRGEDGKLYFDYRERLGSLSTVKIKVGRNILSSSRELKPDQLITRLYPRGCKLKKTEIDDDGTSREIETEERLGIASVNAGRDYIDDDDAVRTYGIIEGTNEWDDVTEPQHLKDKAQRWLADNNRLPSTIAIDGLDLSVLGVDRDKIRLYDWYSCSNPLVGLSENLEVVKAVTNISEPAESSWEFGDVASRQSSSMVSIGQLASQVDVIKSQSQSNAVNISNLVVYTKSAIEVTKTSITSIVGEKISKTNQNVSELRKKVDDVNERFDNQEAMLGKDMEMITTNISTLEQKASSLTASVQQLKSGQESLKSSLEMLPDSIKLEVREEYTDYVSGQLSPIRDSVSSLQLSAEGMSVSVKQLESSYGECYEPGEYQQKTVDVDGFVKLFVGASVCVRFENANKSDYPTLAVGDTKEYPILVNGAPISKSLWWGDGDVCTFVFNGEGWAMSDSGAKSRIKQLADSIALEVSGGLGSTASIVMSVNGKKSTQNIDMSGIRDAFKNDTSSIDINAGTITFNSGTFVVNSENFSVNKRGSIVATDGNIGGFSVTKNGIGNGSINLHSGGIDLHYQRNSYLTVNVGLIGSSGYANDESRCGLAFSLSSLGDYMSWLADGKDGKTSTMKLTYTRESLGNYSADTLHLGCDMDAHNYLLKNAWLDKATSGAKGGINVMKDGAYYPIKLLSTDGRWSWTAYVKNGLLYAEL